MPDRLTFGVDDPPPVAADNGLIEVGWNPVCGHIVHWGFPTIWTATDASLTYGRLPADEAIARSGPCSTCAPLSGVQTTAWDEL